MKHKMQQFLMGSSLPKETLLNTGWLLFRLHIGLSIAIHAGWPKMNTLAAPGWFNDQVAGLGFTFPSPAFWATLASWGEFVGGIGIALGLLTRFNAIQLAFQFFVISFIWFDKPEPLTGMYFQQTLFWAYVLTVFAGSGRFSIDHLLLHRKKSVEPVVVKTAIACLLVCLTLAAPAQNKALTGSGKVVTKKFAFSGFDKLDIRNMDGLATIEIGKPFGAEVVIDDNLESLLVAEVVDGILRLELKGNSNNRLYVENTQIRVNITMPEISVLRQSGNNDLRVNGIIGRYFRIEHSGNGNAILNGRIDELDIRKDGNGNLDAAGLVAGKANLNKQGNGDLLFNTAAPFTIEGSGNGDMINKGTGRAIGEKLSGNGRLLYFSAGQVTMSHNQTSINDFKRLTGTWKGQLTYLDYTSNNNVSMEANTLFEIVSDSSFDQFIYYSAEPHKNADSRYTIRENGSVLNEMKLVERKEEKGKLLLVFEYRGPDGNDNRMATMQRIMELSGKVLTIIKMVKYDGEDHFIQRHQYRFSSSLVQ